MGIKDIFNASKIKAENDNLKSLMTPKLQEASTLLAKIEELKTSILQLDKEFSSKSAKLQKVNDEIDKKKKLLITFDDDILFQDFGLYQPRFNFATSNEYKSLILRIRENQNSCIKLGQATTENMNFIC